MNRKVEHINKTNPKFLPHLGMRIVKTSIAVFLCLIIHYLMGYEGMMLQSCITAIICVQPYMNDTKRFAFNRGIGTLIGGIWGLLFLLVMKQFETHVLIVYVCMAIGVLIVLYSTVAIRLSDAAGLCAITFLCIAVGYNDDDPALITTVSRLFDTIVGIIVALLVNIIHLPKITENNKIFFLHLNDLVEDRLSEINSATLIALNHLYNDGAKISLISPWAPAHILSQIEDLHTTTPAIVMDGAALYDISNRKYIKTDNLDYDDANFLCHTLKDMNLGYCVYAVRNNTTLIYRQGNLNTAEEMELDKLEQSDLRNYIDGFYSKEDKICCVRTIDTDDVIKELEMDLSWALPKEIYRLETRKQPFLKGYSGLYIYSADSSTDKMRAYLCDTYYKEIASLEQVEIIPTRDDYKPARDSILLIHRLRHLYERIGFKSLKK